MAQDAFASSRETQMPYADHPTPLDRYAARVREAACQYRRDCAILSEVGAYSRLQSEQQRAMRELVTGEYRRMVEVRDASQGAGPLEVALSGSGSSNPWKARGRLSGRPFSF